MQAVKIKPKQNIKSNQFIEAIKVNDIVALKHLYKINYPKVEVLVLKNNGTKEHAKDIFQDAFLALWKNVKQDKFVPQNESSINGYLYTIAKHKWMDYLRSKDYKKTVVTVKNAFYNKKEKKKNQSGVHTGRKNRKDYKKHG